MSTVCRRQGVVHQPYLQPIFARPNSANCGRVATTDGSPAFRGAGWWLAGPDSWVRAPEALRRASDNERFAIKSSRLAPLDERLRRNARVSGPRDMLLATLGPNGATKLYLYAYGVDMRKSFDGLMVIVRCEFLRNVSHVDLFLLL